MKKTEIPIVFAANNNYVPYMSVMMQSIMENADKDRQYIFYVLHHDNLESSEDLLKKQIANFPQFSIELINVTELISKYKFFITGHLTVETYFRLLIPELLGEYQKAIYLDCDMVCCTDIASLFDIDLKDRLLAVVWDQEIGRYFSKKGINQLKSMGHNTFLSLKNPEEYFNAGMIVFNVELFRKTISIDKLLELAAGRKWHICDQDVLNYLAEGKTLLLPFYWNFMYGRFVMNLPEHLKKEYNEAEEKPLILHYKPWEKGHFIPHFELFWKYATRTAFINTIVDRMKSDGLVDYSFQKPILNDITHRKGLGLRFILTCIKTWLFRIKKIPD